MAKNLGKEAGKQEFARKLLERDPRADEQTINEAWREAGRRGTIGRSAVAKVRAKLGLDDNAPADAPVSPPKPEANGTPPKLDRLAEDSTREHTLEELEIDLDGVLFRLMGLGGFPEAEELIRRSRRIIILASRR